MGLEIEFWFVSRTGHYYKTPVSNHLDILETLYKAMPLSQNQPLKPRYLLKVYK